MSETRKFQGIVLFIDEKKKSFILAMGFQYLFVKYIKMEKKIKIGLKVIVEGKLDDNSFLEKKLNLTSIQILNTKKISIKKEFIRKFNTRERILCSKFKNGEECKNRFCKFRHFYISHLEEKLARSEQNHQRFLNDSINQRDPEDPFHETEKKGSCWRHSLFAQFIVHTFGKEFLLNNGKIGVLDVAGRFGRLSSILKNQYDVHSIVIDPFLPDEISEEKKKESKRLCEPFDQNFKQSEQLTKLIKECKIIVGLHPDECTEDIIKIAVSQKKAFACIPCCLYPSQTHITRFEDWFEYLKSIGGKNVKTQFLNFKGRNKVIFSYGENKKETEY